MGGELHRVGIADMLWTGEKGSWSGNALANDPGLTYNVHRRCNCTRASPRSGVGAARNRHFGFSAPVGG